MNNGEKYVNWFGFHHEPKTNANKLYNAYRKNTTQTITNGTANWITTISSGATVTFNEDGSVTDNAAANKGLDKYKIVKAGKVLTITITKADGGTSHTFKYDTTADAQTVYGENTAPSKGGVVFGSAGSHQNYCSGAFVYGDMKIMAFKEITEGFVKVSLADAEYADNSVSGNVKTFNFIGDAISNAKVIMAAYKGNDMVGVTIKTVTINNIDKFEDSFSFSVEEKPDTVRVFAWEGFDTLKPYCTLATAQIN